MIKAHEQQLELRLPRIGTIRKAAPEVAAVEAAGV